MRKHDNTERKQSNHAKDDASFIETKLLTYPQAAKYLGISYEYLRKLKARGEVPYVQIGDLVRFRPASLDRWIQRKEVS